jgi:hypothetical protein
MMEILQGATTDVDVDEMSMMNNQSGKRQPVPGVSDRSPLSGLWLIQRPRAPTRRPPTRDERRTETCHFHFLPLSLLCRSANLTPCYPFLVR